MPRQNTALFLRCTNWAYAHDFKIKLSMYSSHITASTKRLNLVSCIHKNKYNTSVSDINKDSVHTNEKAIKKSGSTKDETNNYKLIDENNFQEIDTMSQEKKTVKKKKQNAVPSPWKYDFKPILIPPKSTNIGGYGVYKSKKLAQFYSNNKNTNIKQQSQYLSEIGKMWKAISESEKLEWKEKAKVVNEKRNLERLKWWETVDFGLISLENIRREKVNASGLRQGKHPLPKLVDPRKPKRPQLPFSLFSSELLRGKSGDGKSVGILSKTVSLKWEQLSEEEKNVYKEWFNKELVDYYEKIKKYKQLIASNQGT